MSDLSAKHCAVCEGGVPALTGPEIQTLLKAIPEWHVNADNTEIFRLFAFTNFSQTMFFVNAIAFIASKEKHHPDMEVHYNSVNVRYSTHAIGGLTENDFICAAKVNDLLNSAK